MMLVAITGTPGAGKTSACQSLLSMGHTVLDLNEIAMEHNFIVGYDNGRDTKIVDVEKLDDYVKKMDSKETILLTGHLSHHLSVDLVIVLRCNPRELEKRLKSRGYSDRKIRENIEAEAIDVITIEAIDVHDKVYEIDTTNKKPEEVAMAILQILGGDTEDYETGNVDWSSEVLRWY